MRVTSTGGDVATLAVLSPGRFFGELALLQEHHTRTATVVALEPTETVTLSRAVFAEARRSHPELVDVVNRLLAETVERLSQALLEAMYLGVDERVARRLVELAEIYRSGAARVVVPITQDDLAGMAGTTRPTANLVLGRLAEAGRGAAGARPDRGHRPRGPAPPRRPARLTARRAVSGRWTPARAARSSPGTA